MSKEGLNHHVAQHPDPTYEAVLHNVRQEARELKKKQQAENGFTCIKAVRFYLKMNGYELADDLAIRDVYTGQVYRSVVSGSKRSKAPKY